MKHVFSFFTALLLAQLLFGQEISIKGKIKNYSGSDSLIVKIYSQPNPLETKVGVSKKGEFSYNYIGFFASKSDFIVRDCMFFCEDKQVNKRLSIIRKVLIIQLFD